MTEHAWWQVSPAGERQRVSLLRDSRGDITFFFHVVRDVDRERLVDAYQDRGREVLSVECGEHRHAIASVYETDHGPLWVARVADRALNRQNVTQHKEAGVTGRVPEAYGVLLDFLDGVARLDTECSGRRLPVDPRTVRSAIGAGHRVAKVRHGSVMLDLKF